jgi:membrane protein required for colicin V production
MSWVGTPVMADVLGFLVIFLGVILCGSLIAALLSRLFRWIGLSWFNHLLGGIAGFFRGALIIAALLDILVAYSPSPTPEFLENSRLLPYAGEVSWWLADLAPRELKDAFTEQMENLKQLWQHMRQQHSHEAMLEIPHC